MGCVVRAVVDFDSLGIIDFGLWVALHIDARGHWKRFVSTEASVC